MQGHDEAPQDHDAKRLSDQAKSEPTFSPVIRPRLGVLIGLWLFFGPQVLVVICVLLFGSRQVSRMPLSLDGGYALLWGAIWGVVLYKVTRRYLQCRSGTPPTVDDEDAGEDEPDEFDGVWDTPDGETDSVVESESPSSGQKGLGPILAVISLWFGMVPLHFILTGFFTWVSGGMITRTVDTVVLVFELFYVVVAVCVTLKCLGSSRKGESDDHHDS